MTSSPRALRVSPPADVAAGDWVFEQAAPEIGGAARSYARSTLQHRTLPLREAEAARFHIARINDCQICLAYRARGDGEEPVGEELYAAEEQWQSDPSLSDRERMAVEYADRFATDHLGLDDAFWARMHAAFDDREIAELTLCVAEWLAVGRVNVVLGLDLTCEL